MTLVSPASAWAQSSNSYAAPLGEVVDVLSGESVISRGIAEGLAASLVSQPGVTQLEVEHPGFQAAIEADALAALGKFLHEQYPTLRAQLNSVARRTLTPAEAKQTATYLSSSAGRRMVASWTQSSETDLTRYWAQYVSGYGQDVPEDIVQTDSAFATSGGVAALTRLNNALASPLLAWSERFKITMRPRLIASVQATAQRFGLCSNIQCSAQ
jgi:hypothetical protein